MLTIKACAVSIPPLRSQHEVALKGDASQKFSVDWDLAYPNVNFSYTKCQDNDKYITYTGKLAFDALLEKFSIKKDENINKNVNAFVKTICKAFEDNRVTLEKWQQKYFALEFRDEGDKTLFKVYLKDD